ncbi:MAG: hypothetical protein EXQ52_18725 [Bryobacterales bacterium]|nr:hypothetical protein [Bryobacterales bacterium]
MSWWEKKTQPTSVRVAHPTVLPANPDKPRMEASMPEPAPKSVSPMSHEPARTILGPSVTLRGELASEEDLVIEGKFDGSLHLRDHCLTVGPQGEVKADI